MSERPTDSGIEITITAAREPSVTAVTGLVPARSTERWLVVAEDGWRVARGRPADVVPVLPSDDSAKGTAEAWLDATVACDQAKAGMLQLTPTPLGAPGLAKAPCGSKSKLGLDAVRPLSELPDSTVFVSAFGAEVGRWARSVDVSGDGVFHHRPRTPRGRVAGHGSGPSGTSSPVTATPSAAGVHRGFTLPTSKGNT